MVLKKRHNIKVSVIMACYNSEKFLEEAIKSILEQTLREFELIIINDGSSDDSQKIIKKYMKKDDRIVLINNKFNIGPAKSRNKGLKKSKGKYIAILDSDDLSEKRRLEIQYNYLEKFSDIFLLGTSALIIDQFGKIISKFEKYDHSSILAWRLPKSCGIIHSSVMFRNEKNNFYDPKFPCAQDYKFYLDILKKNKKITNIPDFLTRYRINPNSISVLKGGQQILLKNKIQEDYKFLTQRVPLWERFYFILFLTIFYIKTFFGKRGYFL